MKYLTPEDIERIEKEIEDFATEPHFISAGSMAIKTIELGGREVQLQFKIEADEDEFYDD